MLQLSSEKDKLHMEKEDHIALASAIAKIIRDNYPK